MLTIEQIQSVAKIVTPIALDIYDKEDGASIFPLLAKTATPRGNGKKGTLEWWAAFPQMLEWDDKKVIQKAFKDDLEYTIKPYEVTFAFDRFLATFDTAVVSASELAPQIARAFINGKVLKAYAPMRDNALTYDGQSFFDTDHEHPDGSTFSNKVLATRTSAASPTIADARAELKAAMALLQTNSLIRNTLVRTASMGESLVVIAKSFAVWSAYNDLLTEEKVGTDTNRFRGAFTLLRDFSPASGTENYVDIVSAMPNGPRPTVAVIKQEPQGLQFDLSSSFTNREIPFGMEAAYAFEPGFMQCAVRVYQS